ncbi:LysR family transcriptional regulator [Pseudochelatococcus contaminans]|nr:LysR family transcriptional regulator [Pseudochelatococcus contaminans]
MLDRRVRYFLAIIEHGSLRSASKALRLSQPTLTKAIHDLEIELGSPLLRRHGRGVSMTPTGQILHRRASNMALEDRYARTEIDASRNRVNEVLRIGAGPVWACRYLPDALAAFTRQCPSWYVTLQVGITRTLQDRAVSGDLDICFGSIDDLRDTHEIDFNYEPLTTFDMGAFVREGHPLLAANDILRLRDMLAYQWLTYQNDLDVISRINNSFREEQLLPPRVSINTSSLLAGFAITSTSDAIFCLPEPMVPEAARHGLERLPIRLWTYKAGVWLHQAAQRKREVHQLLAIVRAQLAACGIQTEHAGRATHTAG